MTENVRVLIAEDEALIAEELRDRLESLGMDVLGVAATGGDAIAQARKVKPDLLLMDIHLKGAVDGIEAVTELRRELDLPVIYITAHSDDATIDRAKRTQPLGYVIKPFGERELHVAIELGLHKHEAERKLRESEQRYATTLMSIGDAVIATDVEGRITFMNPVAEALTRCKQSDASGLPVDTVFRVIHPRTREALENPVAEALRKGCVLSVCDPSLLVARDGTEVLIDDTAAPIRVDHDRVSGAVLVFRDITSRLQAAEALRKAEEELRQAERVEAIGRLAGGVAHDINNRMTVVMGGCEVLLDELAPGSQHLELAKDMKDAGDRAVSLVRQLLTFARRQQQLLPSDVDLNDIVASMEQTIRRLLGADTTVVLRLRSDIGQVRVDSRQVEQVITNLVTNSHDAMPRGGTLTIETRSQVVDGHTKTPDVPPGNYVVLAAVDTGVGIDAATKAHIFEPFFTTKPMGEGAGGLGLATVYGIVKQSGGGICVSSEPGKGTAFEIYFPEVEASDPRPAPAESSALEWRSEIILLVEDNDRLRALMSSTLQRDGYTVLQATNGVEALRLYESRPQIDLLLTDAVMPHLSGRALAKHLVASHPGLRVLFMSGYAEDHILHRGIATARISLIYKPFRVRDLPPAVRQALDAAAPFSAEALSDEPEATGAS